MAAFFTSMQQHPNCCASAVACTSARIGYILDTVALAVSIIIVWILGLLLGIQ